MTDYEEGFENGERAGFTAGFAAGFWSAVMLIGGTVLAGLISMRAMGM